jgi:uncharacterized protein YaiL (DUF2058 family)
MRNPLQEQLLKAGLVKKDKVAQVVREQNKQRAGKSPPAPATGQVDAQRLQAERAERDRALSAERNAQARIAELHAQIRQIVDTQRVKREGDIDYRFTDDDKIRSVLVDASQRAQLASGSLAIARHGQGYELIPRAAADKIHARDTTVVVLDHGRTEANSNDDADDEYYKQFQVPDDLIW